MSIQTNVHFGRDIIPVEVDTDATVSLFKSQLYSLSGVPNEKQTLLVKTLRSALHDDMLVRDIPGIKDNMEFLLIGSALICGLPGKVDLKNEALEEEGAAVRRAGLGNVSNTCYINAVIQLLSPCEKLMEILQSYKVTDFVSGDHKITVETKKLFEEIQKSELKTIYPAKFIQAVRDIYPNFNERDGFTYRQQDAYEFYTNLMNSFNNRLTATCCDKENANENLIADLFKVYSKNQEEWGLTIDITNETSRMEFAIDDLVAKFGKFTKLGQYLTIHFNRFEFDRYTSTLKKIVKYVEFPEELKTERYCDTPGTYELSGIVVHKGDSVNSGHYIAYVKYSNEWLRFDDDKVTPVLKKEVMDRAGGSSCVYIAMYSKIE